MRTQKNVISFIVFDSKSGVQRQYHIPKWNFKVAFFLFGIFGCVLGFLGYEFAHSTGYLVRISQLERENQYLRGEGQILMENLKGVKKSLAQVEDYSKKLNSLVHFRVKKVSEKTGLGPLTTEEAAIFQASSEYRDFAQALPSGLNLDRLIFKPIIQEMDQVKALAVNQTHQLQKLLSSLSKKKSLLAATPTVAPVRGWITSNFGPRISPFTGRKTHHKGIDIASPVGTPIYAPANGVVIFSGKKSGYGKFVMVAHGHGVVTRYGHNAQNLVRVGQKVKRGDQIAAVGMTGRSTGPHVHYEVWVDGKPLNPRKFILNAEQLGLPVADFYF